MKQFFQHIKKSIYGPEYYHELLGRSFVFSWKYYSALSLVIALFLTVIVSIPLVPLVNKALGELPERFFTYYPDELEVVVVKGVVATNVPEPYFLPIPQMIQADIEPHADGTHLAVIDTKTPFSFEQFRSFNSVLWIGVDQLAIRGEHGGVRLVPFDNEVNLVLNENVFRRLEQKIEPLYKFVAPGLITLIFLGLLIGLGVNFIYLLFGAALIFVLGRLLKQGWSYGTSYRIGLHAITLPVFLSSTFSMLGVPILDTPFLSSAIMLTIVYVNFKGGTPVVTPLTPTA